LESGTHNLPGIAGLGEAVRYLLRRGVAAIARRECSLTRRLVAGLTKIDGVTVYGPPGEKPRVAAVSFTIRGMDPVYVAAELEKRADIACRPGLHCAWLAHCTQGTQRSGTVRLSPGPFTKTAEIDTALQCVAEVAQEALSRP
jgi:selenocysteine lyase/cysteine desulfurase